MQGNFTAARGRNGLRRGAAALLFLWLGVIAPAAPASAQQGEAVGQVTRQQGVVTALHATAARPLHIGASVFRGDRIITASAAKVEIAFADGSTLSVGAETSVDVEDYSPARRQGGLRLIIGIIRTSLSDLWRGRFEVRSRAAVASVRSTEWVTQAEDGHTAVFVVSGEVAVTSTTAGGTVLLGEGDGTDVELGQPPSPPVQWGAGRVQDVLARTQLP